MDGDGERGTAEQGPERGTAEPGPAPGPEEGSEPGPGQVPGAEREPSEFARWPAGERRELLDDDGEVIWPWDPRHPGPPAVGPEDWWGDPVPGWRPRRRGERFRPSTSLAVALWPARPPGGQPLELHDGRTGGPSPRLSVRLPVWLHERLVDAAAAAGRTPSGVVRDLPVFHLGEG